MTATFFQRPWTCTNRSYFFSGISHPLQKGEQDSGASPCDNPKNRARRRRLFVAPALLHGHQCMVNETRTIKEVVKSVRDQGGEEIAIVRCSDGTYGVARDGK